MALPVMLVACGDEGGEGELVDLVQLSQGASAEAPVQAARLGTPESQALADSLGDQDARQALADEPPDGMTGLAFVLLGCQDTGADLEITDGEISATLTSDEVVNCAVADEYLAIFRVSDDAIPDGADL